MRTVVALQKRFDSTPDGRVWAAGWLDYTFWGRYLEVFDEVHVAARVRTVERAPPNAQRVDGPRVSFARFPYYVGPWQFVRKYFALRRSVREALSPTDAVILRVPGRIATSFEGPLRHTGRPYGVEVVGDPYDVFAPGGVRSMLRPFLRWWIPRDLRRQCDRACAASYVTAGTLQRRYPPAADAYATACSDIDLGGEAFVAEPRPVCTDKRFSVLMIGSLEQLYKAPDVLIKAVATNVHNGLDLQLTIVGDGKHRAELEALAQGCGVADRVRFTGQLPGGDCVRAELDRADLFVLPSRTEGLPRALIEAMARGLPCLGSDVGGIPELLSPEELVPSGVVKVLAAKIQEVLTNRDRLARLSARNLKKAREFHSGILQPRRRAFYEAVRQATLNWQRVQRSLTQ